MLSTALRGRISPARTFIPIFRLQFRRNASFPPHNVIKMPALSPTMTAGNVGVWSKKPGDSLSPGDVLVEIETDKAMMEFEFQEEGVLARILKEDGEREVSVGNPIAVVVEEGTDIAPFASFSLADAGGDVPRPQASKKDDADAQPASSATPAPPPEDTGPSKGQKLQTALDREPNISASAKRLALEKNLNISHIKGSGKGGQITDADVLKSAGAVSTASAYEDSPISNMRKTIASRLKESTQNNPHFYITTSISVTKLIKLRQALNAASDGKFKLSLNDFMIKSMAVASRRVPTVNSSWRDGVIRQFKSVDVSVAVATPTGLITPVVTGCDTRGLESISAAVKELAKRARENKLKPEEYQGGTISISNMGMNPAVDHFTAIINPPQAAILAVGTTKKVAIQAEAQADGQPNFEWDEQVTITASFDHKVVDGAIGADWIRELKRVIENPLELLL